jgi:hypothetical protein
MSLYIDLSEFLTNPITTGIQRIAGEICKYAPANELLPVRYHAGGYLALPPALVAAIARHFMEAGKRGSEEIKKIGAVGDGRSIKLSKSDSVLVPEVFDNAERLKFFREMPADEFARCRFIVFDLLPITHPECFAIETFVGIHGYYRMLREATCCGFISEDTRDDYYRRLKRTDARGGVVLPLGCDALGPRLDRPKINRPLTFSVLGTIEPRKNHEMICCGGLKDSSFHL